MSLATVIAVLPLLACASCLLLMCRPGKNTCHPDPEQEKNELRTEIAALRAELAAREEEPSARP